MLNLPTVTLLCVETRDPKLAHWAIRECLRETNFAKVVLVTNLDNVTQKMHGVEYVQAPSIKTIKDYSDFLLLGLDQYIDGSHVLIIQWDSFITHPNLWSDEFLNYDYIGSVWPHHPKTPVGNGGFSLRSIQLLQAIKCPDFIKNHPEDYCICAINKELLETKHGIKFAPTELAEKFAVERSPWHESFGFHGFFNFGNVLDDEKLEEYLKLIPRSYLSALDSYDLINSLKEHGRIAIAKKIAKKIRFRWKMRNFYLKMKFWLAFA